MTVSIVTDNCPMVEPQYALQPESPHEFLLNLFLGKIFIAVHRAEALRSGQQRAAAVSVDAAALKHIWTHVNAYHVIIESVLVKNCLGYLVVKVRGELESPAVEDEIIKILLAGSAVAADSAMIPRPSVIQGRLIKAYLVPRHIISLGRSNAHYVRAAFLNVTGHNHKGFETQYIVCYVNIAVEDLVQFIPFGIAMRPCKLHSALRLPLCRQSSHKLIYHFINPAAKI